MKANAVVLRHRTALVGSTCVWLALSGCFFDQLQRSNESDIQRIEQKQANLQTQQQRSTALQQQEDQLADELSQRSMSLDELNDRVQRINQSNGKMLAENAAFRDRYDDLLAQVKATNEQLAFAEQAEPVEVRRQKIAVLKAQLKAQLDELLR